MENIVNFPKHQATKIRRRNDREIDDGSWNPESSRGDIAWLLRSSASENYVKAKDKTLKIKSKTKLF